MKNTTRVEENSATPSIFFASGSKGLDVRADGKGGTLARGWYVKAPGRLSAGPFSKRQASARAAQLRGQLTFRRVRAGWYVASIGDGHFIHICRTSTRRPRWGWDVWHPSDNEHEIPTNRNLMIDTGLRELDEAKLSAEQHVRKLLA